VADDASLPDEEIAQLRKQLEVSAQHVADLENALLSSRRIGIALGIVMERYKVTAEVAFEVLRTLSMERNEKLREVADRIGQTGELPAS
jgi:AmiR/NasT family two-component response regulator